MTPDNRLRALRIALVMFGLIFTLGIYPLSIVWPSGWSWLPAQPALFQMLLGVYATLGVFLLLAVREPAKHTSLLWFTVWSSVVHAAMMAVHAVMGGQLGHLYGDVAALTLVAVVLGLLTPRPQTA
jgi:hypothetical protein